MKFAHNFPLWNVLHRLLAGQGQAARHAYTVTVPAPRSTHADNVVALRPSGRADERSCAIRQLPSTPAARVASR
jgi:hypothetical protein